MLASSAWRHSRDRMNFYYLPRPKGTRTIAFRRHYRKIADSGEFYRKNDIHMVLIMNSFFWHIVRKALWKNTYFCERILVVHCNRKTSLKHDQVKKKINKKNANKNQKIKFQIHGNAWLLHNWYCITHYCYSYVDCSDVERNKSPTINKALSKMIKSMSPALQQPIYTRSIHRAFSLRPWQYLWPTLTIRHRFRRQTLADHRFWQLISRHTRDTLMYDNSLFWSCTE